MTEIAQPSLNRVSLTHIIELAIQKTYHDLTVLAELLPRKRDFERKVEIVNFAERTRQLFIRLLALVRWASGASKIEQCMDIVTFLDKQALLFINTADNMANIARNTLVQARLPSFQLPCAVEVLTLGTYSRMPTCVRDRIIPPDPISLDDKRATLARLDYIIEQRLSRSEIHPSMRNLRIGYGRVTFHVENEFDLKLTVLGDGPNLPWCVLGLDLLVEDVDTGEGKDLVHPAHLKLMERMIQQKMNESSTPLVDVFAKLHNFCLNLQIEVLHDQIERLMRERLASFIKIKEHIPGQELAITYWGCKNILKIQTDQTDSSKPLKLLHQPELIFDVSYVDHNKDNIFRPGNVSIEQLITDTIQKRAYIKLNQLANELRDKKYGRCTISGAPSLLHVCCLDPCAPSEELIISIDLNGSYLAHVPQYEKTCPLADNIQESLNSNRSKLGTYFDQLKIWLTKKRCIRTIDYLSVTATESLPLCSKANHAKLDEKVPRLFFQFNKYNHYYLMAEMFTSDTHPFTVHIRYSLLVTEPVPNIIGDGLDIVETDTSVETVKRDLVVVENILRLDVQAIVGSNYCYESIAQEKSLAFNNIGLSKRENVKSARGSIVDDSSGYDICHHSGTKPPVALVNELPQLVSFCEEKLAHLALEKELRNRNLDYEVSHAETSGFAYCITFSRLPNLKSNGHSNALRRDTSVMTICLHEKPQSSKIWHCSYIFKNCPITTRSFKEQSPRRLVFTPYESPLLNPTMVSKFIDDTLLDWACMAHLYDVVKDFSRDIQNDPTILDKIILKSFNYKKLVILYGPLRNFSVTLLWKPVDRKFLLIFSVVGGSPFTLNPHSCLAIHYKHEFNQHKSIKTLVNSLNATLQPLAVLQSFPTYPFLGLYSSRPAVPVTSSCLIPLSTTRAKLIYRNLHSIDIRIQSDGMMVVRDGSYSRFDLGKTIEDLNPISNFELLVLRVEPAMSYLLSLNEFRNVFQVHHLEKHLGISFMFRNILDRLTQTKFSARALSPRNDTSVISYASEHLQFRFSVDKTRVLVQLKVTPIMMDEWRTEEIDVLERYFETRIGSYPFKADPFSGFCRLLFNYPKNVLRDFISIFKLELYSEHLDPNIQWNIALCPLITSATPFITPGYPSICPLRSVTLFVFQLTRRGNHGPTAPSIHVALSYDAAQNNLCVYIPPRNEATVANQLPQLAGIDGHLKQFCDQFKASGNPACVIYPAIRHLITIPNLLYTYKSDSMDQ